MTGGQHSELLQPLASFEIAMPRRILFGRGKHRQASEMILQQGNRVLLVHGADAKRASWLVEALGDADVQAIACKGEPDLALVEAARETTREFKPQLVVALGGGAALDLGKALAALVPASRPVTDYLEVVGNGLPIEEAPLPFIAIPTTSGTGSEVTKNAVIGVPSHRRKVSLRDQRMLANLVIVDPALTDHCPRNVTLASGLDAITQLIEPYISARANPYTDSLCLNALPSALAAIRVLSQPEDATARDAMSWASLCSGLALANAGLGAVHGFAGVIGGITGAPHGEICASLLPAVLETNHRAMLETGLDTSRIDHVAKLIASEFKVPDANAFPALANWSAIAGIRSLTELGLAESDFAQVSGEARYSSSMSANPVELSIAQLRYILQRSCQQFLRLT